MSNVIQWRPDPDKEWRIKRAAQYEKHDAEKYAVPEPTPADPTRPVPHKPMKLIKFNSKGLPL